MAESTSSPRRVHSPHTTIPTRKAALSHALPMHLHCGAVVHQGRRQGVSQRHRVQLHPVHQAPDPRREYANIVPTTCDVELIPSALFSRHILMAGDVFEMPCTYIQLTTGRIRRPETRRPTRRAAEISRGAGPGRGGEGFPLRRRQIRDPG